MEPFQYSTLGLFEKRIEGDDCLLQLARRRFAEAGMGAEMHAGTPDQLEPLMHFRPEGNAPVVVHLPRDFDLLEEESRKRIAQIAAAFAGRVHGLVIHDNAAMATRRNDYVEAAWLVDDLLEKIKHSPILFIEYAAGLAPVDFAQFFSEIPDLERISACLDTGHAGIRAARAAYARSHGGEDVCALKHQTARLPDLMRDIDVAVAAGAKAVLGLVGNICGLRKPVHFHLHDGHPLSTASPFGISDHLSFLADIPIPFERLGRRALTPMFGPRGLMRLIHRAIRSIGHHRLSLTLEIHPTYQRRPLGDAASLFEQWTDKTNAEQMNHWLWILACNHQLLLQAIQAAAPKEPEPSIARFGSGKHTV
jgi:hypothetical protein